MHAGRVDLLALEVLSHLEHELLGTADVVFGSAVAEVEIIRADLGKVHSVVVVVGDASEVRLGQVSLEDVGLEVGSVSRDASDLLVEGNAAARAVDPRDWAMRLSLRDGVEDGHHGSDTNTSGDEDKGNIGGVGHVEEELAGRVGKLNEVTLLLVIDEEVGDNARVEGTATEVSTSAAHVKALVTLDSDSVVVRSRAVAQRVLSGLEISLLRDVDTD